MEITFENVRFCYDDGKPVISGLSMTIGQGQLVAITGPPSSGTKTLTRLLAGELLPDSGNLFVPTHLRLLRVAIKPILWDGPLALSVFYGLLGTHQCTRLEDYRNLQAAEIERGLRICRRLNIPEHLVNEIRDDITGAADEHEVDRHQSELKNHKVVSSIPASSRTKIQIACALISDPPILVLDKPLQSLTIADASRVMECLREFVDNRGLEKNTVHQYGRRPRTCIITSSSPMLLAAADEVLTISEDGSVKPNFDTEALMGETEKLIHDKEADVVRGKSFARHTRENSVQFDSPHSAAKRSHTSNGADHSLEEFQSI
jgi:ABC-type multidrug transport system ATPase subunit